MNCYSFRYTSVKILSIIFSCLSGLYLMDSHSHRAKEFNAIQMSLQHDATASEAPIADEYLASNDFSLTHKNGKDESVQHVLMYTRQGDNLLRECIFDREKILILTQTLIWFTHSTYRVSLPPVWHPSILIAHRRLII